MFTPAALAGATQTCKFIGHELRQLAFTTHLPRAGHRARVCVPFSLTLTTMQCVVVNMAVPDSQMKTPIETLARSQNSSKVIWLVNIKAALGQISQTLKSGLFIAMFYVCGRSVARQPGVASILQCL